MSSVVYFFDDCAGAIKIGYSTDVDARAKSVKTASGRQIKIIGYTAGDRRQERQVHLALAEHRLSGEWFFDCPAVRDVIANILSHGLERAGFTSRPDPEPELPTAAEARRLAEIILRCAGEVPVDGPGQVCGIDRSILWRLRYRPTRDVYADELTLLRNGALLATEIATRRLHEDRAWVVSVCEECEAQQLRFEHGRAEIAALEARAVLRQAGVEADEVVDAQRQRLTAGAPARRRP